MAMGTSEVFNEVIDTITKLDTHGIPDKRKIVLRPLIQYLQACVDLKKEIRLNFICTHNSRRSHLSQVWGQTLSSYLNIPNVFCYSGGTEATALFPMAAKALIQSGFKVKMLSEGENPVYAIKYAQNAHPVIGFSKKYDDCFNPASGFAAIMTCAEADKGCPIVSGAEQRISITYEDPKAFDNTQMQEEKYIERSNQIATELLYVFTQLKLTSQQ